MKNTKFQISDKVVEVNNEEVDGEIDEESPPKDYQPSLEDLERMKNAPMIDLDLHMGGAKDAEEGLAWLAEQDEKRRQNYQG